MRRIFFTFLCFVLCLVLSSCSLSKNHVKLASERKLLSWCKYSFGDCEMLDFTKEEYKHVGVLRDKEKDFTYTVSSYVTSVGMDGSTFWYEESRSSDFADVYLDVFQQNCKDRIFQIESKYSSKIDFDCYVDFCKIYASSEDDAINTAFDFMKIMNDYDLPGYDPEQLVIILGSDNDTKTEAEICYFTYKGNLYYISDVIQYDDNMMMYHLGDYPYYKK